MTGVAHPTGRIDGSSIWSALPTPFVTLPRAARTFEDEDVAVVCTGVVDGSIQRVGARRDDDVDRAGRREQAE